MATSDNRAVSGLLLAAVTSAMILALLVPLAGCGAARTPSGHLSDLAARSLAPPDFGAVAVDGHGVTASILAGRSSTVADFVRTWDDRRRNGEEAQLGAGLPTEDVFPEPSATAVAHDTASSVSCITFLGLLEFCVPTGSEVAAS